MTSKMGLLRFGMPSRRISLLSLSCLATLIAGLQVGCGGGSAGPVNPVLPESTQPVATVPPAVVSVRFYTEFQAGASANQCEAKSSVPASQRLKTAVAQLEAAGIAVVASSCGNTGLFYPAVCGGATGGLFLVTVKPAPAGDLLALGFIPTPSDRSPPIVFDCTLAGF